ncbi:probable ubiquitin-like-specific protease 2A isoform X1 [Coffea arabica]|uniref:Probable ubiquitin-like-specific protease 2A isoform X1 n=1 Tax=Coffea arabica TaxID=13443 RepID=A0A6P6WPQ0_COFAR|nr:probable ubiquitin-like-specific protease 2A isoform X1 [Coffea arabica]
MASTEPLEGRQTGCGLVQWYQPAALDDRVSKELNVDPVFENVPRSCRSRRRTIGKETIKVAESGNHENEGHLGANLLNKRQRTRRKRTRRALADSSDSEVIIPHIRLRGRQRGTVDYSNLTTKYRKLDSKTFERYLEDIWSRISEEQRNSFVYLDSLWFSLYMQSPFKEKVLNWVKRKNIFSKKYIMVPIVMWSHWSLLILCNFGQSEQSQTITPCMLLLDSLQTTDPRRLEPGIRKFVLDIHNVEERPRNKLLLNKIPLLIPQVPQQRSGEECGCYVLQYISSFIENAPENFSISDGYPYFMKEDWFTLEGLDNFRKTLEVNSASRNSSILEK